MAEDAFEVFVRLHAIALLRTAFLLTGNRHTAEDLLQDTLAHLYPQWARVSAADVPVAYVRKALANRFLSSRRKAMNSELPVWEVPDRWDGQDLGETVSTRRAIWQALGGLPERQRAAIVLRYFHDLTDEQIGELVGCRVATVRSLISRGLSSVRAGAAVSGWPASGVEASS